MNSSPKKSGRHAGVSSEPASSRSIISPLKKCPSKQITSHIPLRSPQCLPQSYTFIQPQTQCQTDPMSATHHVHSKLQQSCVDPYLQPAQMYNARNSGDTIPGVPVNQSVFVDQQMHSQQYPVYHPPQTQQGTLVHDGLNHYFSPSFLPSSERPPQYQQETVLGSHHPTNTSQIMVGIAEPQPAAPTSLATMERCRSLKERIYDRLQRPRRPGAANIVPNTGAPDPTTAETTSGEDGIRTSSPVEITKDIYDHERPFPVVTVFEVERLDGPDVKGSAGVGEDKIANYFLQKSAFNENKSDTTREVLFMATECAQMVREMEKRLTDCEATCTSTKEELETTKAELVAAKSTIETITAEKDTLQSKVVDLEVTVEKQKEEHDSYMKAEKERETSSSQQALTDAQMSYKSEISQVRGDLEKAVFAVEEGKTERKRLEDTIADLKEQISRTTNSTDTNILTIQKLTNELLLAKQQTTFISAGYKKQDEELRALRGKVGTQTEELLKLRAMEIRYNDAVRERDVAVAELDRSREMIQEYPLLKAEANALRDTTARLESAIETKDSRISELKDLVDLIRNQASAVYQQARGFNSEAAASVARGGMDGGYCYLSNPKYGGEIGTLIHDVEMEERRIEDERRQWRHKLDR